MAKHWIKGAIKHPGALRAKAKRMGMKGSGPIPATVLGKLEHSSNPTTRKQANLAKTLKGMH
jgi:hypothetical protein